MELHKHDAWYAAYALDPLHAYKDGDGWRLALCALSMDERQAAARAISRAAQPCSEEDVARLRLAPFSKHHCGDLADLLPFLTARNAVGNGRHTAASANLRRGFWCEEIAKQQFPLISRAAVRLLSMHASTAAAERTWSAYGCMYTPKRSSLKLSTAQKLVYIKGNCSANEIGEPSMLATVAGGG
jgi:hypothetical protein